MPLDNKRLNALARQRGFPDYTTYKAWQAKQAKGTQGVASKAAPKNWLQKLGPLHPANMLDYVSEKLKKATGS